MFSDATPTLYYLAGATGWSSTFDGRPAVMLNPATLQVTVSPAGAIAAGAQWQLDGASQKIKVNGVILQDYTNASGYFLNDGQSGAFVLELQ